MQQQANITTQQIQIKQQHTNKHERNDKLKKNTQTKTQQHIQHHHSNTKSTPHTNTTNTLHQTNKNKTL